MDTQESKKLLFDAIGMYRNYIETDDPVMSAQDAMNAGLLYRINPLDDDEREKIKALNELIRLADKGQVAIIPPKAEQPVKSQRLPAKELDCMKAGFRFCDLTSSLLEIKWGIFDVAYYSHPLEGNVMFLSPTKLIDEGVKS